MNEDIQSLQICLDNYQRGLPDADPVWPDKIAQAFLYTHRHLFDKGLTVTTVREHCNESNNNFFANVSSFHSAFKKTIGVSPAQYRKMGNKRFLKRKIKKKSKR